MQVKYSPDRSPAAAAFEVPRVVLHEDRVVIQALEPETAEVVREAVGPRIEFGIRHGLAGRRHDERRLIRSILNVRAGVHKTPRGLSILTAVSQLTGTLRRVASAD